MINYLKRNPISFIIILGFLVRLTFLLFGAEIFYGREDFYSNTDTNVWKEGWQNLIEYGSFTVNRGIFNGHFGRMPGFSYYIGIFNFFCGGDWQLTYKVIVWFQIFLDSVSVFLVYGISKTMMPSKVMRWYISAALYALYPFIIVWTSIAYSECPAVFLMLLSIYIGINAKSYPGYLFSGMVCGLSVLFRPQLLLLVLVLFIYLALKRKLSLRIRVIHIAVFFSGVAVTYGIWPVRNYILSSRVILTQDLSGITNWREDVLSYMNYIYLMKSEWNPEFESIIHNQDSVFSNWDNFEKKDSVLLEETVFLCRHCGTGFSEWEGFWKAPISDLERNCTKKIASNFNYLAAKQIRENPGKAFFFVPLQNLKKAVFKTELINNNGIAGKASSLLFILRSMLIISGLIGVVIMFREKISSVMIPTLFFLFLYIILCFGVGPQFRNIEIRYFLPADILLLIPAGALFSELLRWVFKFRTS